MSDADHIQDADQGEIHSDSERNVREGAFEREHARLLEIIEQLVPMLRSSLSGETDPALRRLWLKGCLCQIRELADVATNIVEQDEAEFREMIRQINERGDARLAAQP